MSRRAASWFAVLWLAILTNGLFSLLAFESAGWLLVSRWVVVVSASACAYIFVAHAVFNARNVDADLPDADDPESAA